MVEVFTHTSKGGVCAANTNGLTRMVSLALRSGVLIDEIKDQLRGISCPACLKLKAQGKTIDGMSCPDILSRTIEEFEDAKQFNSQSLPSVSTTKKTEHADATDKCPECGGVIQYQEGCRTCSNCGWSKCS